MKVKIIKKPIIGVSWEKVEYDSVEKIIEHGGILEMVREPPEDNRIVYKTRIKKMEIEA